MDASIIDTPLKPKEKQSHNVINDDNDETGDVNLEKDYLKSVDTERAKKAGKLRYGYNNQYITDEEDLVLGVTSTSANVNDVSNLDEDLESADLPEHIPLKADKGYKSKKNDNILKKKKIKKSYTKEDQKKIRNSQNGKNDLIN